MVCVTEALSTEKDEVKTGPSAPNSKKGACDLSELRIETGERKSQPWGSVKTRVDQGTSSSGHDGPSLPTPHSEQQ